MDSYTGEYYYYYYDEEEHENGTLSMEPDEPEDNNEPDLSYLILGLVLPSVVAVAGLLGNIISVVVLSRPKMRGSFSALLIGE